MPNLEPRGGRPRGDGKAGSIKPVGRGQDANATTWPLDMSRPAWESNQNGPPAERNADGPLACRSPPAVHRRRREVHGQVINATAARTVPLTLAAEGPALPRGGDPQRPGAGKNCGDDQPERKTARIWLRRRAHRLAVPLTTARRQEWGARCRRAVPGLSNARHQLIPRCRASAFNH